MRGILGLCLSVALGFVVIAASPSGAESASSAYGHRGKVVIRNLQFVSQQTVLVGDNLVFGTTIAPLSQVTITGLDQFTSYDLGADLDQYGNVVNPLTFYLFKKYVAVAY